MGVDGSAEPVLPLRIVVDDSEAIEKTAARRDARRLTNVLGGYASWMGAVWIVLGILDLSTGHPFRSVFGWCCLVLGVFWLIQGRRGFALPRPSVPTAFVVSGDGIVVALRQEAAPRTYAWRRVRTAINDPDYFIVIVDAGHALRKRRFYVPKPADGALRESVWSAFCAHMIATRGLRATPPQWLSEIHNTVFA